MTILEEAFIIDKFVISRKKLAGIYGTERVTTPDEQKDNPSVSGRASKSTPEKIL